MSILPPATVNGEQLVSGESALRLALVATTDESGLSLKAATVLAVQNDPYRLDTPASHRDGSWLGMQLRELGVGDRKIHLRGMHYVLIGRVKPDGSTYTNTDPDWHWLAGTVKAARWLGYVAFNQVIDQRNAAPVVRISFPAEPRPYLDVGVWVDIPPVEEIMPTAMAVGFAGRQAHKLVLFGEKSSLESVLAPIAERYDADLYLPTGEISDTMLHQMAAVGAEDGRPMIVLCFSDCDPAGWQMPISIGRKLQAFRTALFPELDFEVHRVGLTPVQVRQYGLPSTPLKATERRAGRWTTAMGVEQTEVDALAALQPTLLADLARAAITPYVDNTLQLRVTQAYTAWRAEAQGVVDAAVTDQVLGDLRADAQERLAELAEQVDELNESLRVDASAFDLPTPTVPDPVVTPEVHPLPLLASRWSFTEQTKALVASRAYDVDAAEGDPR